MTGLSAVVISVGGIITTVVMAARKVIVRGARSLGTFGRAVVNITKKFGPVIAALGNLLGTILTLGAKGINFLAKNMWLLAMTIGYFLYNEYKSRRRYNK